MVAGRYRVEKLLGVGGMGCVYRAEHVHMRKTVALKTLHPEMTQLPEAVARFEREAIAASRIDHPNIATATDFGRLDDGSYFLVLQFVEGRSLRDTIDEIGPLPLARALRIARQVASALKAAHALDIVHRDLKPDNVMLVDSEQGEFVKVLDFGIAKVTIEGSGGLTRMGSVFGTPEYMSPEQCMGQPVDARSDLYALGVILHEMLTGKRPFEADDAVVILRRQIMDAPPPLPADVPAEVVALVSALMAKGVDDRIQSAQLLIDAIDAFSGSATPAASAAAPQRKPLGSDGAIPGAASAPAASAPNAAVAPARRPSPLDELKAVALRPVRLGSARLPLGVVVAAGAVPAVLGLIGIVLLVLVARACSGSGSARGTGQPADSSPVTESTASSAGTQPSPAASRTAQREVERTEGIPIYKRSDDDWVTLARSYSQLNRFEDAASAYRAALSVRRTIRKDPVVLEDLKRAGRDSSAFPIVVNLSETVLGPNGLDLMWELWQEAKGDPARADQADILHKKLTILSRRASPALRVAIELEATNSCDRLADILPRAIKEADTRSVERLESLAKTTGCGDTGKSDCYSCLRSDTKLALATAAARSRPAPKLGQTPDSDY